MILCTNGHLTIEGTGGELITEAAVILKEIHDTAAEKYGKTFADELLVLIGRLATASMESKEEAEKALDDALEGLFS